MKILLYLFFVMCSLSASAQVDESTQASITIHFLKGQSAIYQLNTKAQIDSVVAILLDNDSLTLSIMGYARAAEGNDSVVKYLSLNRAKAIKNYVLGRGVHPTRIFSVEGERAGYSTGKVKINRPKPKPTPIIDSPKMDSIIHLPNVWPELDSFINPPHGIIVPFDTDDYYLLPKAYCVLDSVVAVLLANPLMRLSIEGHAHPSEKGKTTFALDRLASNRAQIIKDYLTTRFINPNRITSLLGFGSTRLLDKESVHRNYRGEIHLFF